jgi:hypothetical protein
MKYTVNKQYLQRAVKVYCVTFALFFTVTLPIYYFIQKEAFFPLSLVTAGVFALFTSSMVTRELEETTLEITPQMMDPQKGLQWYYQETLNLLLSLRYKALERTTEEEIFRPRDLYQLLGGKVYIVRTPYTLTVKGPRGFVKILSSTLDLSKIFL